jgi:hypothetical protein
MVAVGEICVTVAVQNNAGQRIYADRGRAADLDLRDPSR